MLKTNFHFPRPESLTRGVDGEVSGSQEEGVA